MQLPDGNSLEPADFYFIDFDKLSDEQIAQMRNHKAQLIHRWRRFAKRRIALRCQNTGRPVEQMSDKSFVEHMLSKVFPYDTPSKRNFK